MGDKLRSQDAILALYEKLPWQHCNFTCEINYYKLPLKFGTKIKE